MDATTISYPPAWITTFLGILVSLLVLEQSVYRYKKKNLPGNAWTIPVIGKFADSLNPTMEKYMHSWKYALSATSVFNIFIVMASENEYTRRILNSPSSAEPCLVQSMKTIIQADNWVFLTGKAHLEYRRGLNILFTRPALGMYLKTQQSVYKEFFERWQSDPDPAKPYQLEFRELNMFTSLRVFCGDGIPLHAQQEISDKYWLITNALELVNFPFAFPGTKVYRAVQARKVAMSWFEKSAAYSKKKMAAGEEPSSLTDRWVKEMIRGINYDPASGEDKPSVPRMFSDREIAMAIMTFLFASQDAMSSAITYGFQLLADHPEVFAKIRAEQDALRGHDHGAYVNIDDIDKMTYTRAATKEILRLRPPVIMVPYKATKPFQISDDYVAPAGSIVIPSFWNSLHDPSVYPDPDSFKPERWLPGGDSVNSPAKNYIVFGHGPHRCIGIDYVYIHMTAVLGTAALTMDWDHEVTPASDQYSIIATIFPKDGCRIKFRPRE